MIEIFLSYSRTDKNTIDATINRLNLSASKYKLWYYNPISKMSMEEILEKLSATDLFILMASDNSLNSPYVQKELDKAIRLTQEGIIKGIYPILIDNKINVEVDNRIPGCIKSRFSSAASPAKAAKIIEEITNKY